MVWISGFINVSSIFQSIFKKLYKYYVNQIVGNNSLIKQTFLLYEIPLALLGE
jgi:hypothetical protein